MYLNLVRTVAIARRGKRIAYLPIAYRLLANSPNDTRCLDTGMVLRQVVGHSAPPDRACGCCEQSDEPKSYFEAATMQYNRIGTPITMIMSSRFRSMKRFNQPGVLST